VNRIGFRARVAFFAAVFVLGLSDASRAGIMTVYSCHAPSGRSVGTYGWEPAHSRSSDTCATGLDGALRVESTADPATSNFAWKLTVAPDTTLDTFTAQICGGADQVGVGGVTIAEYSDTQFIRTVRSAPSTRMQMGCIGPKPYCCDPENLASGGGDRVRLLQLSMYCWTPCVGTVRGAISGFRADISDYEPPAASAVRGSLATSAAQVTEETLEFDASDKGVGVFRAVAEARINRTGEWREIVTAPVESGGRCTPLRETDYLYEFTAPKPCPTTVTAARLTLGVGALPPGTHTLRVRLEDAAGNSNVLLESRTYSVPSLAETTPPLAAGDAQSALTAAPAPIAFAGTRAPQPFGQISISRPRAGGLRSSRSFTITGRMLDVAGRPLPQAVVFVQSRSYFPKLHAAGGSWTSFGSTTTDKDGTFHARIPAGPSRSIKVTYGYGASASDAQVDFTVPAAVDLRAERTRVRNGSSAVFRGRVASPIPSGGVFVALEVREPKRWVPVATTRRWVKTSGTGSFTLAYRFLRTFHPATYRFRVVADEDSAFQYRRGTSRTINVHVRP
jgi:hypothetical protein